MPVSIWYFVIGVFSSLTFALGSLLSSLFAISYCFDTRIPLRLHFLSHDASTIPICVPCRCSCSPAFGVFHDDILYFSYLPPLCLIASTTDRHIFKACDPSQNIITNAPLLLVSVVCSQITSADTLSLQITTLSQSPFRCLHHSSSELRYFSPHPRQALSSLKSFLQL